MHHDPRNFSDPSRFDPDRWVVGGIVSLNHDCAAQPQTGCFARSKLRFPLFHSRRICQNREYVFKLGVSVLNIAHVKRKQAYQRPFKSFDSINVYRAVWTLSATCKLSCFRSFLDIPLWSTPPKTKEICPGRHYSLFSKAASNSVVPVFKPLSKEHLHIFRNCIQHATACKESLHPPALFHR